MRLDNYLVERGYFDSRTKAKQAIERGEIYVNSIKVTKCAYLIDEQKEVEIKRICENSFVSLGGFKLKKAIDDFNFNANGLIAADIGASTGGFTDCLLLLGVKKVYAVDLNDKLLHDKLKNDERVIPLIKNARDLVANDFDDKLDLIVADLSFISVTYVLEVFSKLLTDGAKLIILIKPQFESGEKRRFKNGIVKDKKLQLSICNTVYDCALKYNLAPIGFTTAPIVKDKNIEFLMMFEKGGKTKIDKTVLDF